MKNHDAIQFFTGRTPKLIFLFVKYVADVLVYSNLCVCDRTIYVQHYKWLANERAKR